MKRIIIFILLSFIIIFSLTACGSKENVLKQSNTQKETQSQEDNQSKKQQEAQSQKENNEDNENEEEPDLEGEVISFSDSGLVLAQTITGEDGKEATMSKNADNVIKINVTYSDNITFKIKNYSISAQKTLSIEDATKKDVKKRTSLMLYGEFKDEKNFTADNVVIFRFKD